MKFDSKSQRVKYSIYTLAIGMLVAGGYFIYRAINLL